MRSRMHGVRHFELALASLKTRHYICLLAAVSLFSQGGEAQKAKPLEGYTLVWSDEFNGKDGSLPDSSKWTYDIGGGGGGGHEVGDYTKRRENARGEEGERVITAGGGAVNARRRQEM